MTNLARGPLGAFLPWIPSRTDPVPLPRPGQGHSWSQDTALDRSLAEQWESEGGAKAVDTTPHPRLGLAPSASLRPVQETYEQKLEWTRLAFAAAQARWEARPLVGPVTRNDEGEEPAGKAAGNRARVAFLAVKGATMQGWLTHCASESRSHTVGAGPDPEQTIVR